MHQRALRTVLLIQAIEETDRTGEVIPLADRAAASREVLREYPKLSEARLPGIPSPGGEPPEAPPAILPPTA